MSMTAKKVLDRAEELGMLDPKVIDELRRQVAESKFSISAEAIVKVLVDKKHLTQFQAKKLVGEVTSEPEAPPAKRGSITRTPGKSAPASPKADEDDLLLNFGGGSAPATVPTASADDDDIVDLEAALPPAQPLRAEVKPLGPEKLTAKQPAKTKPAGPTAPAAGQGVVGLEPLTPGAKSGPRSTPSGPIATPGLTLLTPVAKPAVSVPLPGLTPLAPISTSPSPGFTPLGPGLSPIQQPATVPGLSPMPMQQPGVTPLQPFSPTAAPAPSMPALTMLGNAPPATLGSGADPLLSGQFGGIGGLGTLGPPPPPPEATPTKKRLARAWDSPLLLIGGGGLGILLIAFLVLYFALTRGSAQELLTEANEKYSAGTYSTAISLYEKFISKYPDDPNKSLATVKIGMAKIHQNYDGAKDMTRALEVAAQVLPEIANEASFDEVRPELESMLPLIAENFASSARTATDLKRMEAQVKLAHSALELVNNAAYLPSSRRKNQQAKIDSILEKVHVAERTINQGKALANAMTAMQEKLKAGEISAAYDVRARLLQDYPTLETQSEVVKNTVAIAQRERDLATTAPQNQAASTEDPHRPTHRQLALARRSGEAISAPADATALLLVGGNVYAIDVAAGKVRWWRSVGAATRMRPSPLAGGDALVVDEAHRDVLRLAAATGKLVWRQTFAQGFAAPQVIGDYVFVTLESGRVVRLNAANGELDRAADLPQAASVGVGGDSRGKVMYQLAEHSTLYSLAVDDSLGEPLACRSAYYLGHPRGSIAVPPVVVVGYVFVFENEGAGTCVVHALAADKEGKLAPAREPIRLRGRVTIPPISQRSRLIVVTDLGDTLALEVNSGDAARPVNITAQLVGGLSQSTIGYAALSGSRLLVADTKLAEYEISATKEELDNRQSSFAGDAFIAPLQLFGNTLIHTRQRQGARSVTVTGVDLNDNKSWQLVLSSPVVGVNAFLEQKQFAAINADGDIFDVSVDSFKEVVRDQPTVSASGLSAQSYGEPVTLPEGKSVLCERSGKLWALAAGRPGGGLERISLEAADGDVIAARPVAFAGGMLTPLARGSIWLLDPASGVALGGTTPFQPETSPGTKAKWLPPLVVDERQFIVIDAVRKAIYLARREEKPSPFLVQTRSLDVDYEPVSAALVDKTLLVVARGASEDEIVGLALPSLQETKRLKVGGRVGLRGLEAAGNSVFFETSQGELLKLSSSLEITARVKFPDAPLATAPLASGNDWLLVAQNGKVLRMNGQSGELQTVASAGQSLTGAVQLLGASLLAGGADGTLHVLPLSGGSN